MLLKVSKGFSGVLGNGHVGQVLDVPAKVGKKMIKDGYPVEEVAVDAKETATKEVKVDVGNADNASAADDAGKQAVDGAAS